MNSFTATEQDRAITEFIDIIKFPTVSGDGPSNGSYDNCGRWLLSKLEEIGLDQTFILEESLLGKPIVVGFWEGSNKELPSTFRHIPTF